jgi:hypothetical protein
VKLSDEAIQNLGQRLLDAAHRCNPTGPTGGHLYGNVIVSPQNVGGFPQGHVPTVAFSAQEIAEVGRLMLALPYLREARR